MASTYRALFFVFLAVMGTFLVSYSKAEDAEEADEEEAQAEESQPEETQVENPKPVRRPKNKKTVTQPPYIYSQEYQKPEYQRPEYQKPEYQRPRFSLFDLVTSFLGFSRSNDNIDSPLNNGTEKGLEQSSRSECLSGDCLKEKA